MSSLYSFQVVYESKQLSIVAADPRRTKVNIKSDSIRKDMSGGMEKKQFTVRCFSYYKSWLVLSNNYCWKFTRLQVLQYLCFKILILQDSLDSYHYRKNKMECLFMKRKITIIVYNNYVIKTFIDIKRRYFIEHCIIWIRSKIKIGCHTCLKTSLYKVTVNKTSPNLFIY